MATMVWLLWWTLRRRQGHLYTASVDKPMPLILFEKEARIFRTNFRGPCNKQICDG